MPSFRAKHGLGIVELLIAAAIAAILLSTVGAYFVFQTRITNRTQARNEAEAKARTVAELVIQDLQLAGSRVVNNEGVATSVAMPCSSAPGTTKCIESPSGGTGSLDDLRVYYATSLRTTEPCRRIDYSVHDATLYRSEIPATSVQCGSLVTATSSTTSAALADRVLAFDIDYVCADDAISADPADCYDNPSFPRQAMVGVTVRSDANPDITARVELRTSMPNLRY